MQYTAVHTGKKHDRIVDALRRDRIYSLGTFWHGFWFRDINPNDSKHEASLLLASSLSSCLTAVYAVITTFFLPSHKSHDRKHIHAAILLHRHAASRSVLQLPPVTAYPLYPIQTPLAALTALAVVCCCQTTASSSRKWTPVHPSKQPETLSTGNMQLLGPPKTNFLEAVPCAIAKEDFPVGLGPWG